MSDLHANKYATERVFHSMESDEIDVILIAGDLIGYYYWGVIIDLYSTTLV